MREKRLSGTEKLWLTPRFIPPAPPLPLPAEPDDEEAIPEEASLPLEAEHGSPEAEGREDRKLISEGGRGGAEKVRLRK